MDISADSCVAVAHEKNVTTKYGLLNIKVQQLFEGTDGVVSGCVQNISFDQHYIAVFSYSDSNRMIGSRAVSVVRSGMLYYTSL